MRSCGRHALIAFLALAGCVSFGPESGPPMGTYRERLGGFAGLLRMEDRHAYDPLLAGRAAASPDPWLRAKTALALGGRAGGTARPRPAREAGSRAGGVEGPPPLFLRAGPPKGPGGGGAARRGFR